MLSQTYSGNTDWTIFLWNVVHTWSPQHCIGYFSQKSLSLGSIFHRQFSCAMLAQAYQDNIVYIWLFSCKKMTMICGLGQHYTSNFLVQCCLRCTWATLTRLCTMDCAGNCFVQCWQKQTKTTLCRLFSCKNMSVHSGPILHKIKCIWTTMSIQYSYSTCPNFIDTTFYI